MALNWRIRLGRIRPKFSTSTSSVRKNHNPLKRHGHFDYLTPRSQNYFTKKQTCQVSPILIRLWTCFTSFWRKRKHNFIWVPIVYSMFVHYLRLNDVIAKVSGERRDRPWPPTSKVFFQLFDILYVTWYVGKRISVVSRLVSLLSRVLLASVPVARFFLFLSTSILFRLHPNSRSLFPWRGN